ncbi:TIGR03790 family protein [Deltaproteobacteria bacterium]|nr:TIGR03790 family protein [Deltaproteobacteria bacterium]
MFFIKVEVFFVFFILILSALPAYALSHSEVLVVANRFVPESVDLARYYLEKRGIPKENLLKINTTEKESCSREVYDQEIAEPIRKTIVKNKKIQAIVTIYGVPLKVGSPKLNTDEKWQLKHLQYDSKQLKAALDKLKDEDVPEEKQRLSSELKVVSDQMNELRKGDYSAAVDSELALVLNENYNLKFWLPNPYFVGNRGKELELRREKVLMVSRLDGPSVKLVKRMIDDSIAAEKVGLKGTAYFDAKGKRSEKKKLNGYGLYDHSLHLAADRVRARKLIPVVVDENGTLFQPGEAPDAALYCGHYSYQNYIDAFDWVPGAIGYHMSSVECASLRPGDKRRFWCRSMLEDGAAAVIGPVGEPYLQAFPLPEAFFSFLTDGYYNLVESYFLSLPYLSWRMVLVGDPLYRPFLNSKIAD